MSDNFEKVKLFFLCFCLSKVLLMFFFCSFLRLTAKKNLHVVDKYGPQNAAENDENYERENNGILRVNLHYTCKNLKS